MLPWTTGDASEQHPNSFCSPHMGQSIQLLHRLFHKLKMTSFPQLAWLRPFFYTAPLGRVINSVHSYCGMVPNVLLPPRIFEISCVLSQSSEADLGVMLLDYSAVVHDTDDIMIISETENQPKANFQ